MNTSGKNILVLGGSGFISRKFVDSAIESGHKVWTLTRGKRDLHPGATNLFFERNEVDNLTKAMLPIPAFSLGSALEILLKSISNTN